MFRLVYALSIAQNSAYPPQVIFIKNCMPLKTKLQKKLFYNIESFLKMMTLRYDLTSVTSTGN